MNIKFKKQFINISILLMLGIGNFPLFSFGSEFEKILLQYVLSPSNYNILARPVLEPNEVLIVSIDISLHNFIEMSIHKEFLTVYFSMQMAWQDCDLRWDAEDYGNISELTIPITRIWSPQVIMANSFDPTFDHNTGAIVKNDGTVRYLSIGTLFASCTTNMKYYPFDQHKCTMKFIAWDLSAETVDFKYNSGNGSELVDFKVHDTWEIMKINGSVSHNYYSRGSYPWAELTLDICIRRRGSDEIFNHGVVLTFGTLLLLFSVGGFSPNSGMRFCLGIVTLLIISIISAKLTEEFEVSKLVFYYRILALLAFISILSHILVGFLHDREGRVPELVRNIFCQFRRLDTSTNCTKPENGEKKDKQCSIDTEEIKSELHTLIKQKFEQVEEYGQKLAYNDCRILAKTVNQISFLFFFVSTIIFQIGFHYTFYNLPKMTVD